MGTGTAPRTTHVTLAELFLRATARRPDAVALRQLPTHDGGDWLEISYGELGRAAREIALGLASLEELPALAERVGMEAGPDAATIAADPRVRELLQAEVDAVNARFARIEQIKRFGILDHDLTQAAGELTPTMKLKRPIVYERYADDFAALYEAP
jgi:long-chain acyl-CoA synthetase